MPRGVGTRVALSILNFVKSHRHVVVGSAVLQWCRSIDPKQVVSTAKGHGGEKLWLPPPGTPSRRLPASSASLGHVPGHNFACKQTRQNHAHHGLYLCSNGTGGLLYATNALPEDRGGPVGLFGVSDMEATKRIGQVRRTSADRGGVRPHPPYTVCIVAERRIMS